MGAHVGRHHAVDVGARSPHRPVTREDAPLLGLEPGTPALTMTNRYWDQNGGVVEYAVDFLGTGRELSAEYALD
ncbi:hypothetical protein CUT44_15430 [Streptomyces carminius]|uniref:UbiC transcription regulator-associated domain-containing protein n=1 Tax=Streptomyces carminius TaxID=2665496 RepID=A0A2M8LYE9_9ACTN|nr:hypothetical protein CUT44_15430 [Streptomyces carminius]